MVATHGPATSAAVPGVFEFENGDESENFNLKPLDDRHGPIPDDQRKIGHEVYEARNTLKLLKEHGAFREGKGKASVAYNEFMGRVIQAAKAGCIGPNVDTKLAGEALEQIRADIMRRKGRPLVFVYLAFFALWAAGGVALAIVGLFLARCFASHLMGYGWLLIGTMAGAWFSTAARRWQIAFEDIQEFIDVVYEPVIRVVFVGVLALLLGLFLDVKLLSLKIGSVDLTEFPTNAGLALVLGAITGIGEKVISVQLLERAKMILSSPSRPSAAAS